jgi:hypothetical protein
LTGICRQPWNSFPRNFGEEREQRRAGFLDHGSPDQGAHGQHNRQQQTYGTGWPGLKCAVWQRWRVLLERRTPDVVCLSDLFHGMVYEVGRERAIASNTLYGRTHVWSARMDLYHFFLWVDNDDRYEAGTRKSVQRLPWGPRLISETKIRIMRYVVLVNEFNRMKPARVQVIMLGVRKKTSRGASSFNICTVCRKGALGLRICSPGGQAIPPAWTDRD